MWLRSSTCVSLAAFCALAAGGGPARSGEPKKPVPPDPATTRQQGRAAVERGLGFLQKDAAKWRKERRCSTCHHGTMTVWALSEAKRQGYAVAAEALTETATWAK